MEIEEMFDILLKVFGKLMEHKSKKTRQLLTIFEAKSRCKKLTDCLTSLLEIFNAMLKLHCSISY